MKNKKILGNGLLLFTALIWGTAFVFQRVGMEKIEPITFSAARMALAAVMIGAVAYLTRKRKKTPADTQDHVDAQAPADSQTVTEQKESKKESQTESQKEYRKNTITGGVICGCLLAVASILQQAGLVYTTAGKAGFITAMYMLMVPIFGYIIFKKKSSWLVWLAVLLGVVGMYLLCITDGFYLSTGDALEALCAVVFAFHILCCDRFTRKGDSITISAIQFAVATVISTIAAFIAETPSWDGIVSALVPIIYCGIFSGGIGYTLQMVAQKYTEPAIASLLLSMESVFALIAGVILLDESISIRELSGCIIMFAAIILVQLPKRNNE
ncbi:MAG: DMT family transporter [Lachnospiraceae bacterium]|nr:DMT family transporter [Lachnospiraceae bacterium]